MKIELLINANLTLKQFGDVKLSPRLAYKIMKFCVTARSDEEFYNAKKNEIINAYAIKDGNGNVIITDDGMINIMPDKISEANYALQELNNVEVEAPNVRFTIDELAELKLSVSDMFALDPFIEE